jgi:hypothetical protein
MENGGKRKKAYGSLLRVATNCPAHLLFVTVTTYRAPLSILYVSHA